MDKAGGKTAHLNGDADDDLRLSLWVEGSLGGTTVTHSLVSNSCRIIDSIRRGRHLRWLYLSSSMYDL